MSNGKREMSIISALSQNKYVECHYNSLWFLKYQRIKACHVMLFLILTITSAYAYRQHWNKQKEKRSYKYIRTTVEWE